ncbi:MAG: nucleotidyltransferase [Planctomycetes bacterium]|nr:nucleotidyltransferase [Planctomycetota bacterium]
MELPSYFSDFLTEIRLTSSQIDDCRTGHTTLRRRLLEDGILSKVIVNTFLQGSYRRATAVRPKGDSRADVDVIVVTKLHKDEYTPARALEQFVPFLDKHYEGKYKPQGRSFAIELAYVDLDIVPTAAPSESEIGVLKEEAISDDETPEGATASRGLPGWLTVNAGQPVRFSRAFTENARQDPQWKIEPLLIPDLDVQEWTPTHPLEQIRWTWQKNRACGGHYVNVVKAIKWWRRLNPEPKYPKGYPVEHLIGYNCPDGIESVAAGVTATLEKIAADYQIYAQMKCTPSLLDHGVPQHNVLKRVSGEDFAAFHKLVSAAAATAREALDATTVASSARKWRELFGNKFPDGGEDDDGGDSGGGSGGGGVAAVGGFTPRTEPTVVTGRRFA